MPSLFGQVPNCALCGERWGWGHCSYPFWRGRPREGAGPYGCKIQERPPRSSARDDSVQVSLMGFRSSVVPCSSQ